MIGDEWEKYLRQQPQLQQPLQLTGGLLGDLGENGTSQQQVQELISKGQQASDTMAQNATVANQQAAQAGNSLLQSRMAQTQQAAAQQAQKRQQAGAILGTIAKRLLPFW